MENSLFDSIFKDTTGFVSYSFSHLMGVLVCLILGIIFIYVAKKYWNTEQQYKFAINLTLFLFIFQLSKVAIRYFMGNLDVTNDLPFHLCNILPFFMFVALKLKSKLIFSIIFYWIMAGTMQANFTPTLKDVFPHYEYLRYWIIHMGLPILAIYCIICFGWRLKISDAIRSALALNALAAVVYPINILLGSNYLYLVGKPDGKTLYDLLGDWPLYIFNLELIMAILFPIMTIPFLLLKKPKTSLS